MKDSNVEKYIEDLNVSIGMVRITAAKELGKLGNKLATKALAGALKDTNHSVRSNAAFSLGELGARESVSSLISVLSDPDERVRKSAAKALGMLKARRAVPDLIKMIDDSAASVRKCAARSLGQIGEISGMGALERAAHDPDYLVALEAKEAMKKLS